MRTVNVGQVNEQDMRVSDFWEQRYLSYGQKHKKHSTVSGYKQIWAQHLKVRWKPLSSQRLSRLPPMPRARGVTRKADLFAHQKEEVTNGAR